MSDLVYSNEQLMAHHDYATLQKIDGARMHGGFDTAGEYISPRSLFRWPATLAWKEALEKRGENILDASQEMLSKTNYPNREQQKFLLRNGLGQTLWNSLTVTGVFEGRGKGLCEFNLPDFQDIIEEDISQMSAGHIHKGLLYAHGADEGGDPEFEDIGAHDAMWYALRDLVFGKDAYPLPEIPETLARPDADTPLFPQISDSHSGVLNLLLNLLMIELRAESFFAHCCDLFADETLFTDRRAEALEAKAVVERIRHDEAIHTISLQVLLSELRTLTFKTKDGGRISGAELIDAPWKTVVNWHSSLLQQGTKERDKAAYEAMIRGLENGDALVDQFNALEDSA